MSDVDPQLRKQLQKGLIGALLVLGSLCIVVGVAVALGAAWLVYLLIEDPKSIPLVAQVLAADQDFRAFRGSIGREPFDIEIGPKVFWVSALFVGAIVLGIVMGMAKRLIGAGIELLKPVLDELRR